MGLEYSYSRKERILQNINLHVEKGSIYGFLGPNGSGKTTTLCLLLGLLKNQKGKIEIFDKEIDKDRIGILKKVGTLVENPSLYGHLTAIENLEVYKAIYGVSKDRILEVLESTGLSNTGNKKAKQFSLGMKQRLAIALALLPAPALLILDEPTNGLDPAGIIELRELLVKLNKEHGITILISSHILAEIERIVSHIGIIYKGRLLFQGKLDELHEVHQNQLIINTSDNLVAKAVLNDYNILSQNGHMVIHYEDIAQIAVINKLLVQNDLDVYQLQPKKKDLEQLFIDLTTKTNAFN